MPALENIDSPPRYGGGARLSGRTYVPLYSNISNERYSRARDTRVCYDNSYVPI